MIIVCCSFVRGLYCSCMGEKSREVGEGGLSKIFCFVEYMFLRIFEVALYGRYVFGKMFLY